MRFLRCLCFLIPWLLSADLLAQAPIPPADYYVSPQGRDSWSGKLPTPNLQKSDGPFASIARARDAARADIAAGLRKNLRLHLGEGHYYLPQGMTWGPKDGGNEDFSVTYAAQPGERVQLFGGHPLEKWDPYDDEIFVSPLAPGISAGQVFEDNVRLDLARTPEHGYFELETPVEGQRKRAFLYRDGDLSPAEWDISSATVFLWPGEDWFSVEKPLSHIDPQTRTLTMGNEQGYEMKPGNRYVIRNVLALLDRPGEAMIDTSAGKVYVWPRKTPLQTAQFMVSTAPGLLRIEGTHTQPVRNLHFEGLYLSMSEGDGVIMNHAENCAIRFSRIENAKGHGVRISGHSRANRVYGCEIRENGHHGVSLSGLGPKTREPNVGFHRVENNHIHHCGRLVGHGYGIQISWSGHNEIQNNWIHHLPRYGVSIKGERFQSLKKTLPEVTWENHYDYLHARNNRIAFNHIHHSNQDSQDAGAIEAWGPGRDNVIDYNLIHDTGNAQFGLQSGIYLDDAADYFTVTHNIIYNVRGAGSDQPIFAKGIGNIIQNNILIVDPTNATAIRSFTMMDERTDHHEYTRNIIVFEPASDVPADFGRLGQIVGHLHDQGTTLTWQQAIPETDAYAIWMLYAAENTFENMDDRTTLVADDGEAVLLTQLPNTGDWGNALWQRVGNISLKQGLRNLQWTNVKGGGLNLDALVLSNDSNWKPDDHNIVPSAAGKHTLWLQAEAAKEIREPKEGRIIYGFDNWSDDRVSASDFNLFWNPSGGLTMRGGPADKNFAKWKTLFDGKYDNQSIVADPLFVDPLTHDYRLNPESPALELGFEPIDSSRIGLRADFPARFK
ncbi:right-handed parallel beta-helix repeat-containing protein [Kiritimatiellota bacterium B12222]|nr:right-handed parallel beta-helix repeat-containing protein [Kiritimatiellota bacterium B12222]